MMGRPMATRLVEGGLQAPRVRRLAESDVVFRRRPSLGAGDGIGEGRGPGRVGALITMLPDGKIVRQAVLEGRDAAVEGLEPGALVLDMSSSNPVDTQKLARDLASQGAWRCSMRRYRAA